MLFDAVRDDYCSQVESAIAFSGKPHDFFMQAKIDLLHELSEAGAIPGEGDLLDVGCGPGILHQDLAASYSVTGVDVSAEQLALAGQHNPACRYEQIRGDDLGVGQAHFDIVLAINVAHHVAPANRAGFFRSAAAAVKPGGRFVMIEHNPFNPLTRKVVRDCRFDAGVELLTAGEAQHWLAESGLEDIAVFYFLFFPSAAALPRRVERHLLRRLPLGAQYCAVASRR